MKKLIAIALIASVSAPAFADQQLINSLIGAAVGGGGARALYKGSDNRKRNIITAAGALGGAWVGSKLGDESERRHQEQMYMQQQAIDAVRGDGRGVMGYTVSQPTRQAIRYDDDQGYAPPPAAPIRMSAPAASHQSDCMSTYSDAAAARAYCAGRAEFLRQAYERGARGE